MAIEKKCENCGAKDVCDIYKTYRGTFPCLETAWFTPKEELIRQDERNKIITLLKNDLENFDDQAEDSIETFDFYALTKNVILVDYIKSIIELLEKEN